MNDVRQMDGTGPSPLQSESVCRPRTVAAHEAPFSLLIVSDIRFLREGLAEVLARDGAFCVAAAVAQIGDALAIARAGGVKIILIDAAFPDGLAATKLFHDVVSEAHIVVLALSETETDVIAWAEAGATGYIPRSVGLEDFVTFLKKIVRGEQACSSRVAASLLRRVFRPSNAASRAAAAPAQSIAPPFTAREQQVVALICGGLSNKEISRRLNIGLATTKSHIHNILGKLALERRGQVIRWSRDHAPEFIGGGASSGRLSTAAPPSRQYSSPP